VRVLRAARLSVLLAIGASLAGGSAAVAAPLPAGTSERIEARVSSQPTADRALLSHPRIRIRVNGRIVLNAPVPGCTVCHIDIAHDLHIADLDGDGHLEVALRLMTPRGRCCAWLDVFHRSGARWATATRNFYGCAVGVRDLDANGTEEIVACDSRFANRFTDSAGSLMPLRVWRFGGGRFDLVTRAFPAAIRADEQRAWTISRSFRAKRRDVRGVLAAWAADKALLGEAPDAWRRLGALARAGALTGVDGPQGARYVAFLRRQLATLGYGA
jgi:hypothetical protein